MDSPLQNCPSDIDIVLQFTNNLEAHHRLITYNYISKTVNYINNVCKNYTFLHQLNTSEDQQMEELDISQKKKKGTKEKIGDLLHGKK